MRVASCAGHIGGFHQDKASSVLCSHDPRYSILSKTYSVKQQQPSNTASIQTHQKKWSKEKKVNFFYTKLGAVFSLKMLRIQTQRWQSVAEQITSWHYFVPLKHLCNSECFQDSKFEGHQMINSCLSKSNWECHSAQPTMLCSVKNWGQVKIGPKHVSFWNVVQSPVF